MWRTLLSTELRSHDSNFFILAYTVSVTSLVFWSIHTNLLVNRSYTGFFFDCIAGKTFSSLLSLFISLGSINHERLAQHLGENILTTLSTWTLFLPDAWMGVGRSKFLSKVVSIFNKTPSFLNVKKPPKPKHCTNIPKLFHLIRLFVVPTVTRCWIALTSSKISLVSVSTERSPSISSKG